MSECRLPLTGHGLTSPAHLVYVEYAATPEGVSAYSYTGVERRPVCRDYPCECALGLSPPSGTLATNDVYLHLPTSPVCCRGDEPIWPTVIGSDDEEVRRGQFALFAFQESGPEAAGPASGVDRAGRPKRPRRRVAKRPDLAALPQPFCDSCVDANVEVGVGVGVSDTQVAKRNARERRRVEQVNSAFAELRVHIPGLASGSGKDGDGRRRRLRSVAVDGECSRRRGKHKLGQSWRPADEGWLEGRVDRTNFAAVFASAAATGRLAVYDGDEEDDGDGESEGEFDADEEEVAAASRGSACLRRGDVGWRRDRSHRRAPIVHRKRLSKVRTLRFAIYYIRYLQGLLATDEATLSPSLLFMQCTRHPVAKPA